MSGDWQPSVQKLLASSRIAFLSTLGESGPETSMAPYAMQKGDVLLHLSRLARHTTNIGRDARISLMICTPESACDSPLALPRLSLSGQLDPVRETDFPEACAAYIHHLPEAEPLFAFPDFRLFRLEIREIHWVGGFGMACSISRQAWYRIFDSDVDHGSDA